MTLQQPTLWIELSLSESFLIALGGVISQWAYFESEFDAALEFMRMEPEAKALEIDLPFSFQKRLKLFAKSTKVCFSSCPELIDRLDNIRHDAKRIKKIRDHISHCTWAGEHDSGYLSTDILGKNGHKSQEITVEILHNASCEISALTRRIRAITHGGAFPSDYSFPLTPNEEFVIISFRQRNLPNLPTPGILNFQPPTSWE